MGLRILLRVDLVAKRQQQQKNVDFALNSSTVLPASYHLPIIISSLCYSYIVETLER